MTTTEGRDERYFDWDSLIVRFQPVIYQSYLVYDQMNFLYLGYFVLEEGPGWVWYPVDSRATMADELVSLGSLATELNSMNHGMDSCDENNQEKTT